VSFKDLDGRPSFGPKNAKVTLVEFSDFHCPFCKRVNPTLEQLMKNYQGKIRRIWRQYPLPMHAGADRTAEASECANEQDKFWEYHDKLFEVQGASSFDEASLMSLAEQAGLNKKKFEKCLASGKHKDLIQKEIEAGNQAGVRGTPAVFVNGRLVSGAQPYENFDRIVQSELAKS
jgi:protein-disulfide isomerase